MSNLIEEVAETLYRHSSGMDDEQHELVEGKPRRAWKTAAPWDTNPDELCEWERDEYRIQARAVVALIEAKMEASMKANEGLAAYAHDAWSRWMRYLFEQTVETDRGCVIPTDLVERWKRQMDTPYADLSEGEKESDRQEAIRIMRIFIGDD